MFCSTVGGRGGSGVTVVVSMRVVGLLLISALMILPNATSQLFARSFRAALWWAVLVGVLCSVGGVLVSYVAETPSGGTIVLMAIAAFTLVACATALRTRVTRTRRTVVPALGTARSPDGR